MLEDYKHPDLRYTSTRRKMELDIFIPALALAIEYQGQQHFSDVGSFTPSSKRVEMDKEKQNACR